MRGGGRFAFVPAPPLGYDQGGQMVTPLLKTKLYIPPFGQILRLGSGQGWCRARA